MEKKERVSNFWFGFSLGVLFTIFFAFLFGTRKGRKILKNFLAYFENYEENFHQLLDEVKFLLKEHWQSDQKNSHQEKKVNLSVSEVIDRIKYLASPVKKQTKKFFIKEGKVIEKTS